MPTASAAAAAPAKLALSPTTHVYGTVAIGATSSSQSYAVTNTRGSASGTLAVTMTGANPGEFVIDANTCTGSLAAGAACSVSVHFAPSAVGARKATLSVAGAPGGTVKATLSGTGGTATLALSPTSHAYGSVTIGAASPAQTFTLTNTGVGASGPVTVALSGTNKGDYSIGSSTCGAAIPAGSSCTVGVVFAPTAVGTRNATLTASATPGGTLTASLTGTGAARALLSISPATFDFGSVIEGTNSADQTFTLTNTGLGTSGLVTLGIGGTDPASFVQDATTCGPKLAIGGSCTISAHFAPAGARIYDATLSATASPGGTTTATLTGTGVIPAILSISPTTFDFGSVVSGSQSGQQTFTVTNGGQGSSGTVAVSLSGANQADFTIDSTTCGAALTSNATCTVTVHFTPSTTGAETASLSATSSPGGTATSTLTGTGITQAALSISPSTFDFGPTNPGASSSQQTFTVTNTGQATSGPVSIALTGSNASAFTIDSNTCSAALPGGGTCTVSVHFTAGTPGTITAGLSATASPGGTATAALQGEALSPASLSIAPTFFDYGQQTVGSITDKAFTVTNTGQSQSGQILPQVTGGFSFFYRVIGDTCPSDGLAGGASCTVTVEFEAFESGFFPATLTVQATPGGTAFANLEAAAIEPARFSITNPSDFGNVVIGNSTAAQTLTVTNTGQQTSGVVSAVLGGAAASDYTLDIDTCAATLAPNQSCTVSVHFTPSALGNRSATLTIAANPGGSQALNLHGTGVNVLMVSPTSHAFPNQPASTTSLPFDFTLTNFGSTPLTGFTITASDGTDFPITGDTCLNATIAPGATCKVSITFDASVLGSHASSMNASFVDGNNVTRAVTFDVSGTSVVAPPDIATSMTTQSANFGGATVLITVTNNGSAASAPATMTVDVHFVQSFSNTTGLQTDCTASGNGTDDTFTCPVPSIPGARTYSRTLTIQNLSNQAPHYVQIQATTTMPGDTNTSNDTAFDQVTIG